MKTPRPPTSAFLALFLVASVVSGCSSGSDNPAQGPEVEEPEPDLRDKPGFCARTGDDIVRDAFCAAKEPTVSSLEELKSLLRIEASPYSGVTTATPSVFLGHSTALSGKLVSPINPRLILAGGGGLLLAFQRGVQRVEFAARDRDDYQLNFYLLDFQQACNEWEGGCVHGDLYTPSIESSWTRVSVRDDEDLKNTPSDCRQCHQRGRDEPVFLMRELNAPWTHFLGPTDAGEEQSFLYGTDGGLLSAQYQQAKGDEGYGGMQLDSMGLHSGFTLETLVDAPQVLLFDAPRIVHERFPPGHEWPGVPERSPTWDGGYAAFKRGEQLALPYFDAVVTDARKLERLTNAYRNYRNDALDPADLPDFADVFPDDAKIRAELGLETEPDATPAEALVQACGSCHNDVLDQTITRARFNVGLSRLDGAEIEVAIERLQLPPDDPRAMPPKEARQLTPAVRERVVEYLRAGTFSEADLSLLDHAATVGMIGGEQQPAGPSGLIPDPDDYPEP